MEYVYSEGGGAFTERFTAASDDAAEDHTRRMLREGDHGQESSAKTFRVEASFRRIVDGEPDHGTGWTVRHTFTPAEPPCIIGGTAARPVTAPEGHDWQTSGWAGGGDGESPPRPGSVSSGWGQVRTTYACAQCGGGRIDDLGDTDRANGENIATVEYLPAGTYATARPVYWSVVRGPSGDVDAGAVKPEPAGVGIPAVILEWAAGHGLSAADPDVYLLVATEDEAGEIPGEIAYRTGTVSYGEDQAIRAALAQDRANRAGAAS